MKLSKLNLCYIQNNFICDKNFRERPLPDTKQNRQRDVASLPMYISRENLFPTQCRCSENGSVGT